MKSQTLTVSLVLLLIAAATLPGLSFSLGSSVTSYNNQIIIINDNPIGLYKTESCDPGDRWTDKEAFSSAIIHMVGSTTNGVTTYTTRTDYKEMAYNHMGEKVYLKIDGDGEKDLSLKMGYSSESEQNQILSMVQITLTGGTGSKTIPQTKTSWNTISGEGITITGIPCNTIYELSIQVACTKATVKGVTLENGIPKVDAIGMDITFGVEDKELPFYGCQIDFGTETSGYNGITISSTENHKFVEYAGNNKELKGAVIISAGGTDDSFVGNSTGNDSRVTINSDGIHGFKFYLEQKSNKSNSYFTIKIGDVQYPENGVYYSSGYFGIDSDNTSSYDFSTSKNGVEFIKDDITIEIYGKEPGKEEICLYIIFDDGVTASKAMTSAYSSTGIEATVGREEDVIP